MKLLSDEKQHTRIGAIYSLEGLARLDSSRRGSDGVLTRQIAETLASFIRNSRPKDYPGALPDGATWENDRRPQSKAEADVEAAVLVLVRVFPFERRCDVVDGRMLNLRGAVLNGIEFPESADLRRINFMSGSLRDCHLGTCDFSEAWLVRVDLTNAQMWGANLTRTLLNFADLTNAEVSEATFNETILTGTRMEDLYEEDSLIQEQLSHIRWNRQHPPKLPTHLKAPTDSHNLMPE